MKEPTSVQECVYFTDREIGKGRAKAWVLKEKCPKCQKAILGKPIVKGKVKIRAKEYVCPVCNYQVEKDDYEKTLTANIKYICPDCSHNGETQIPFIRKKIMIIDEETSKKTAVETLRINCEKCKKPIDITKKMK